MDFKIGHTGMLTVEQTQCSTEPQFLSGFLSHHVAAPLGISSSWDIIAIRGSYQRLNTSLLDL